VQSQLFHQQDIFFIPVVVVTCDISGVVESYLFGGVGWYLAR